MTWSNVWHSHSNCAGEISAPSATQEGSKQCPPKTCAGDAPHRLDSHRPDSAASHSQCTPQAPQSGEAEPHNLKLHCTHDLEGTRKFRGGGGGNKGPKNERPIRGLWVLFRWTVSVSVGAVSTSARFSTSTLEEAIVK